MRTIWTAVSILASVHLLALLAFGGWLVATDRLDADRLREIRLLVAEPADGSDAEQPAEASSAPDQAGGVPALTGEQMLEMVMTGFHAESQRGRRLADESEQLTRMVRDELARLESEREALDRDRHQFEAARERLVAVEGSAQFRKALSVLEGLKPDDASGALRQLIEGVPAGPWGVPLLGGVSGLEQAVAYLNAMDDRKRTKVMAEFMATDRALAAALLERLRTHGLPDEAAAATEGPPL